MKFPRLLLLLSLLQNNQPLFSQTPATFPYSVDDGLPSSEVYDILQDKKGYIWIATDRGVSCFDGYQFKNFTSQEGLTDNTVFQLREDYKGRIWFLTFNRKLCFFEEGKIYPYKYNDILLRHLPDNPNLIIHSFVADSSGAISIGFQNGSIVDIDGNGKFYQYPFNHYTIEEKVYAIIDNEKGFRYGSCAVVKDKNGPAIRPTQFKLLFITNNDTIVSKHKPLTNLYTNNFTGIKRKNGNCVFYTPDLITEIDSGKNIKEFPAENKIILRYFEDSDSCLWASFMNGELRRYFPNKSISSKDYEVIFEEKNVNAIFEDHEHGFWFGTAREGVLYSPSLKYRKLRFDKEKEDVVINTFSGNNATLYLGANSGKLYSVDSSGLNQINNKDFSTSPITGLFYDTINSVLWVYSSYNSYLLKKGIKKRLPPRTKMYSFSYNEIDNTIWSNSSHHVFSFNLSGKALDSILSVSRTDAIYADRKGRVLLGTQKGLFVVKNSQLIPYGQEHQLLRSRIACLLQLDDGTLVLATIGNGILLYNGKTVKHISVKEGLLSNIVNSLAKDGSQIWAATNKGLCKLQFTGDTFNISNYNAYNGLPAIDIIKIFVQAGRVWLQTKKDVMYFSSLDTIRNLYPPPIYIKSITINDRQIPFANDISMTHEDDFLKIEFTGLSYRWRGNVHYKYRLEGLNQDWQFTNSSFVQFTSLNPGNYQFEIYASNEEGVWSNTPAKFRFSISPPFWQTWWFGTLIVVIFLLIVLFIYFIRIRNIRNKSHLQQLLSNYRIQALSAQMDPHFVFNSLNSIQAYIITEDKKKATVYLSQFAKLMRIMLRDSRKEEITIEEELEAIELYVLLEKIRFKDKFIFTVDVDSEIKKDETYIPYMLIQPFIENSIRHGLIHKEGDDGAILLSIVKEGKMIICSIEDNGIGREKAQKLKQQINEVHLSAGLSITLERLKLICNDLKQEFFFEYVDKKDTKGEPGGTIVKFGLPHRKRTHAKY